MVGGIASPGTGSLIELLHHVRPQFRHVARHVQDHLAALLRPHAGHIVLSPTAKHLPGMDSIPLASDCRFPVVRAEIGHAVVVGILLRCHPAQAVTVNHGMPAPRFRLGHELAKRRFTSHGRIGIGLNPGATMLPIKDDRHQGPIERRSPFVQIRQRIRQGRVLGILRCRRIPITLAAHRERNGGRRIGDPLGNIGSLGHFGGAEGLLGSPIPIDLGRGVPIAVERTDHDVIGKFGLTRPARAGEMSDAPS